MENKLEHRNFFDAYIANIMLKFSILQLFTLLFVLGFNINFYIINFILTLEELIYLFFVFKESRNIKRYNTLKEKGELVWGKIIPQTIIKCVFNNSYTAIFDIRIVCRYNEKNYKGKMRISGNYEIKDQFLKFISTNDIPILVDTKGNYYVLLSEFAEDHGFKEEYLSVLITSIFLRVVIIILWCLPLYI